MEGRGRSCSSADRVAACCRIVVSFLPACLRSHVEAHRKAEVGAAAVQRQRQCATERLSCSCLPVDSWGGTKEGRGGSCSCVKADAACCKNMFCSCLPVDS